MVWTRVFNAKLKSHLRNDYLRTRREKRKKLNNKAIKDYFVRYNNDIKEFRIWFPETDRVDIKRDVIFRENDYYTDAFNEAKENQSVF